MVDSQSKCGDTELGLQTHSFFLQMLRGCPDNYKVVRAGAKSYTVLTVGLLRIFFYSFEGLSKRAQSDFDRGNVICDEHLDFAFVKTAVVEFDTGRIT